MFCTKKKSSVTVTIEWLELFFCVFFSLPPLVLTWPCSIVDNALVDTIILSKVTENQTVGYTSTFLMFKIANKLFKCQSIFKEQKA